MRPESNVAIYIASQCKLLVVEYAEEPATEADMVAIYIASQCKLLGRPNLGDKRMEYSGNLHRVSV